MPLGELEALGMGFINSIYTNSFKQNHLPLSPKKLCENKKGVLLYIK